ncbi:MAG: 2OG-Fe(II) oxygenase [Steroidobacteraceae bacterium]
MPGAVRKPHPELGIAAGHDRAGRHDDAIDALARGTGAGDAGCTMQLGLRLLTGDRAPLLPAQGLEFLGEACDKGEGEAAARAAGIIALGANVPSNWVAAMDWLRRAATAGWAPARQQLLALCDDRQLAARSTSTATVDWRQVVAATDLAAWRKAPPADVRSDNPRVSEFRNLLRPELCRFFISLAPGRLAPARVYDPVDRKDIVAAHRNNTQAIFGLDTVEVAHVLLQARMSAACGIPALQMEAPAVLHYSPSEEIANHFDFVDPKTTTDYAAEIARNGQRIITFLVYLNDDYDGGETDFPDLGITVKGRTGNGMYFVNALPDLAPDMRMVHAGRPTTRGEKWLITQFVRSRPMR